MELRKGLACSWTRSKEEAVHSSMMTSFILDRASKGLSLHPTCGSGGCSCSGHRMGGVGTMDLSKGWPPATLYSRASLASGSHPKTLPLRYLSPQYHTYSLSLCSIMLLASFMRTPFRPRGFAVSSWVMPAVGRRGLVTNSTRYPAFAFDIDGVLVKVERERRGEKEEWRRTGIQNRIVPRAERKSVDYSV